ncbi:hypothetical protein H4582DRAFT_1458122 [Lactarius indigo]|nr:hypothetical protein H4582DRAFT_1458122 [Lactarius indigo]
MYVLQPSSLSPTHPPSSMSSPGLIITHVVDACPDQTRIHRLLPKLNSRMAFFTSPEQEVYEHRLKRSSSLTSVRSRSRQPSRATKSPTPSRTHTNSRLLPTTSGDVSVPLPPSPIPSPVPSPVPGTSSKLNGSNYDSRLSPKLPRGSVPQKHVSSGHRDDSRSLRVPSSVHEPSQQRQHLDYVVFTLCITYAS